MYLRPNSNLKERLSIAVKDWSPLKIYYLVENSKIFVERDSCL